MSSSSSSSSSFFFINKNNNNSTKSSSSSSSSSSFLSSFFSRTTTKTTKPTTRRNIRRIHEKKEEKEEEEDQKNILLVKEKQIIKDYNNNNNQNTNTNNNNNNNNLLQRRHNTTTTTTTTNNNTTATTASNFNDNNNDDNDNDNDDKKKKKKKGSLYYYYYTKIKKELQLLLYQIKQQNNNNKPSSKNNNIYLIGKTIVLLVLIIVIQYTIMVSIYHLTLKRFNFNNNNNNSKISNNNENNNNENNNNNRFRKRFTKLYTNGNLIPCEWDVDCIPTNSFTSLSSSWLFSSSLSSLQQTNNNNNNNNHYYKQTTITTKQFKLNTKQKLLVRNTLSFDRTICGKRIPKNGGIIEFIPNDICNNNNNININININNNNNIEHHHNSKKNYYNKKINNKKYFNDIINEIPLRVFIGSQTPTDTGKGIPPIIVRYDDTMDDFSSNNIYTDDDRYDTTTDNNNKKNNKKNDNLINDPYNYIYRYNDINYNNNNNQQQVSIKEEMNCSIKCIIVGEPFGVINKLSIDTTPFIIIHSMESSMYYDILKINSKDFLNNIYYATTSFQSDIPLPYFSYTEYPNLQMKPTINFHNAIHGASFIAKNCDSMNQREDILEQFLTVKPSSIYPTTTTSSSSSSSSLFDYMNPFNYLISSTLSTKKEKIRIDSLSTCKNNIKNPLQTLGVSNLNNKTQLMEKYIFHLAFENSNEIDYITEKLWGALSAGVIPIYYGTSNIHDHVPTNSIIAISDYSTTNNTNNNNKDNNNNIYNNNKYNIQKVADHMVHILHNTTLYNSYHEWRYKPLPTKFHMKYDITYTHSNCRICKWSYAKKYGLPWNHTTQTLSNTFLSLVTKNNKDNKNNNKNNDGGNSNNSGTRTICRNKIGLIGQPYKEYYSKLINNNNNENENENKEQQQQQIIPVKVSNFDNTKTCIINDLNRWIHIDVVGNTTTTTTNNNNNNNGILRRAIYPHDGVVDIVFEYYYKKNPTTITTTNNNDNKNTIYIYKMVTPLNTKQVQIKNKRHYIIQDTLSRFTILTSHNITLFNTNTNTNEKEQEEEEEQQQDNEEEKEKDNTSNNNNNVHQNSASNSNNRKKKKKKKKNISQLSSLGTFEIPLSIQQLKDIQQQQQNSSSSRSRFTIRIIIEDLDHHHKGGMKHENYFGKQMIKDFFTPLELYQVVEVVSPTTTSSSKITTTTTTNTQK